MHKEPTPGGSTSVARRKVVYLKYTLPPPPHVSNKFSNIRDTPQPLGSSFTYGCMRPERTTACSVPLALTFAGRRASGL